MSDIRELYQEVIVDHGKNPRNYHVMPDATRHAHGFNPLCGDRIELFLKFDGQLISDVSFSGVGCAISTASASLMTEYIKGKTFAEAKHLFEKFHSMVTKGEHSQELGKLEILSGVKEYPMRVKCATLAWHTLNAALIEEEATVTTE